MGMPAIGKGRHMPIPTSQTSISEQSAALAGTLSAANAAFQVGSKNIAQRTFACHTRF